MDRIERAKVLLAKASDDLDLVKDSLDDPRQRDNVGYHIAMSVEKMSKALASAAGLEYSTNSKDGHRITPLFDLLVDNGAKFICDFSDLLAIEEFDSQSRYFYTTDAEAIELKKLHGRAKELFGIILVKMMKKGYV